MALGLVDDAKMRCDSAGIAPPGGGTLVLPVAGDPPQSPDPVDSKGRPRPPPRWLGRPHCGRRRAPRGVGASDEVMGPVVPRLVRGPRATRLTAGAVTRRRGARCSSTCQLDSPAPEPGDALD